MIVYGIQSNLSDSPLPSTRLRVPRIDEGKGRGAKVNASIGMSHSLVTFHLFGRFGLLGLGSFFRLLGVPFCCLDTLVNPQPA